MRFLGVVFLALSLSGCYLDDTERAYKRGYADGENDHYMIERVQMKQDENEKLKTIVNLCASKFYPTVFIHCEDITPSMIKRTEGYAVSSSYWFQAVYVPIFLILLTVFTFSYLVVLRFFEWREANIPVIDPATATRLEAQTHSLNVFKNSLALIRVQNTELEAELIKRTVHFTQKEQALRAEIEQLKSELVYRNTAIMSADEGILEYIKSDNTDFKF